LASNGGKEKEIARRETGSKFATGTAGAIGNSGFTEIVEAAVGGRTNPGGEVCGSDFFSTAIAGDWSEADTAMRFASGGEDRRATSLLPETDKG